MSRPRRIIPGDAQFVSRRCAHRVFRLRPSEQTNRIFLYALALAAEKTGVRIHAVCVMSDHYHLIVTDVRGELPIFLRELHRTVAKALNAAQGQRENLWSAEPTNVVTPATVEDLEREIAYVVANPVEAGLVESPDDWPGVLLWGEHDIEVERPAEYFSLKAPPTLRLRICSPGMDGGRSFDAERLARTIAAAIGEARDAIRAAGRSFLGRADVLAKSFRDVATSEEKKRDIVPTIAARDPIVRAAVLRARSAFLAAYRAALDAWRANVRDVVFPFGTWWMRVHHRARVADPPLAMDPPVAARLGAEVPATM